MCEKKSSTFFENEKTLFFFLIYLSQGFDRNDCNFFMVDDISLSLKL